MVEQKVVVASALEARPAALFVQTANKFSSSIKLKINDKTVNAKSIMGMFSLGASDGQYATLMVDGEDEIVAMEELKRLLLQ